MDYANLLDVAVNLSNRFDTHWTLFISVHLALIGGIIYVDRPLSWDEKIAAIFIYTGFAVVNSLMMMNQLKLLYTIYLDVVSLETQACCVALHSLEHIKTITERLSMRTQLIIILGIHVVMYFIVVASIIRDKPRKAQSVE